MGNISKFKKRFLAISVIALVMFGCIGYNVVKGIEEDQRLQRELLELQEMEIDIARLKLLEQAELLFKGYYYDEALALLTENTGLVNETTAELAKRINHEKNNLVLYEDTVQHIFFHSLILYPEYLIPNLNVSGGQFNEGFVFQRELIRILPQLLERGYVLYNVNDVFGKDINGIMRQKEIYLPEGKHPLIISMDDPSYHYGIGLAHRMILDENGKLATEVITPQGEAIVTYDGDVMLVINNFVDEHPDFSFRGHKGIIATTGFFGFLGHKLDTDESKQRATAVAGKLKETGWIFASHSYGHTRVGFWGPGSNAGNITRDTARWQEVIEPITGTTNIFVAPFGYTLSGAAMDVILNNGFNIYCNVVASQRISVNDRYALMGRIEIGGYALEFYKSTLDRLFFDVDSVKDSHRPGLR
ncbi:MAG: hypothetical protein FWG89_09475 [Treponema sp.]|nr:hypothetical protein [Treponema sp.]